MSVHALILAGGEGSRLGAVHKDLLRIGSQRLLDRVADRLRDMSTSLLVSTGGQREVLVDGAIAVPDLDLPVAGPLAGLIAAADHLARCSPSDMLITVAVDTPFLPQDYVRRLVAALDGGAYAAQAGWRGNFYPTNAIWRLSALSGLPERARAGDLPNSPKALLAKAEAVQVDWSDTHGQDPFANLNTLTDLTALARRASAERL